MTQDTHATQHAGSVNDFAHVRYQVTDVARSTAFYTERLGFTVGAQVGKAFGSVILGKLRLILGGPGSSGARLLPDGTEQKPGGSNRILVYVDDLDDWIDRLEKDGVPFRNEIESGPGGRQILIADPDGNLVELHEPPK